MGASFDAYAIIGARLTIEEFDKLMDTEHPQICCGHNMVKGHKYCPYCSEEIPQQTTPRSYLDCCDLIIPGFKPLKVVKDDDDQPSIVYIGFSMHIYYQQDYDEDRHFIQAKQAAMLLPTVWETLYAIGYDKPQNFGLYVVCNVDA